MKRRIPIKPEPEMGFTAQVFNLAGDGDRIAREGKRTAEDRAAALKWDRDHQAWLPGTEAQ